MGGYGSTRWRAHIRKETVERSICLNARVLLDPALHTGHAANLTWRLPFLAWSPEAAARLSGGVVHLRQTAWPPAFEQWIETTRGRMGFGRTLYYVCPGRSGACRRRVRTLFWPIFREPGFFCRSCHRLGYESQRRFRAEHGLLVC